MLKSFVVCLSLLCAAQSLPAQKARAPKAVAQTADFRIIGVDKTQHFVIVSDKTARDRARVTAISEGICKGRGEFCVVHFWTNEKKAGTHLPMTEAAVGSIVASYVRDLKKPSAGMQCYQFGHPSEKCTGR